ncbi:MULTISPECIES: hypothetical protein [unclassified Clostridium]|uniref:hypothetical protein n=1 Tax=unclassified Clostridium TaxID=2614128 RepID=UPI0020794364|nr:MULTISPECIES: hypothetical protein [unclassified Clostridium]
MKDLLDLLNSGDYITLLILSLIFIFIWLFKDMKKSLFEIKRSDLTFIDQSIEYHAQSLKSIYFFLNNSISESELLDTLYSSYKYLDKNIIDVIDKFSSSSSIISSEEKSTLLINLSKELKGKISILKDKQLHQTINKHYKLCIFDFGDIANKNNFDIYYNAFLYSLIILTISASTVELSTYIYTLTPENSIPLTILILGDMFWLFLLPISIELLLKKLYKKLYLFILFFLSPFASAYFIHICQNYICKIFIIIIFIICIFINFYVNFKYSKLLHKK